MLVVQKIRIGKKVMNNQNEDGNIVTDFTEEEKLEERKDLLIKRDDMADFFTILLDQLESLEAKIAENQEFLIDLAEIKESTLQIKNRLLNSTSTNYNLLSKIIRELELINSASTQYAQKHGYLVVEFTQRQNPNYDFSEFKITNCIEKPYLLTVKYREKYGVIRENLYKRDFPLEFLLPAILSDFGKKGWEVIESCKERNTWLFLMKQTHNFTKELLDSIKKFPLEMEKDEGVDLLPDD